MMRRLRAWLRALAGAAVAAALVLPGLAPTAGAQNTICGPTTLQGTIVMGPDGILRCGPGEQPIVREELAEPQPSRLVVRSALASFIAMANIGIVDEESPFRAEFLDACGTFPTRVFRPHETMLPALANAHISAATRLASSPSRSPLLNKSYDFAVGLGSASDNRQRNELRWYIELLDGAGLLDPSSGAPGYEGIQGADPSGDAPLPSPVPGTSLRDLANRAFVAGGLKAGAAPLPWYSVAGANDVRPFGVLPVNAGMDALQEAWATGALKLGTLGPQHVRRVCEDPSRLADPSFWTTLVADLGSVAVVTADPDRRPLSRSDWIAEHRATTGAPAGHGFDRTPCTDASGAPLARACYSFDQPPMKFIALDTTPATGPGGADIDNDQLDWLRRELRASTSRYFTPDGTEEKTGNPDRIVVIMQHHGTAALDGGVTGEGASGAELRSMLLRYPNVVLQLTADEGRHRITPHADTSLETGYWEVGTASIADWPSQSRSIEIADNHDGTLSIHSVLVDADAAPDPRSLHWTRDDPTDERALGAQERINEVWLASAAREIAAHDGVATAELAGAPRDRNVELLVANPLGVTQRPGLPSLPDLPNPLQPFPSLPSLPGFTPPDFSFPNPPTGSAQPQFPFPTPPAPPVVTGPGLAVLPSANGGWGGRALRLLTPAALVALWLTRSRVRRWMVGI